MNNGGFNTSRPSKCMFNRCDWPYEGFHICVDLSTPEPKIEISQARSPEHRAKLAEAARANALERYKERDPKIVDMYVHEELGMKDIANKLGISYPTVRATLVRNNIQIRPKGYTNYRPGNNVRGSFN